MSSSQVFIHLRKEGKNMMQNCISWYRGKATEEDRRTLTDFYPIYCWESSCCLTNSYSCIPNNWCIKMVCRFGAYFELFIFFKSEYITMFYSIGADMLGHCMFFQKSYQCFILCLQDSYQTILSKVSTICVHYQLNTCLVLILCFHKQFVIPFSPYTILFCCNVNTERFDSVCNPFYIMK